MIRSIQCCLEAWCIGKYIVLSANPATLYFKVLKLLDIRVYVPQQDGKLSAGRVRTEFHADIYRMPEIAPSLLPADVVL